MRKFIYLIFFFMCYFFCVYSASAETLADGRYVIKSALNDNKVLDLVGKSKNNGTNVQLFTNKNGINQQWDIKLLGNGYYSITTAMDNEKSLDVFKSSNIPGTNIQLWNYSGGNNQQWLIKDAGDGYYYIVSKCNGLYMDIFKGIDSDGTNVQMFEYRGGNNQKFKFEEVAIEKPSETIKSGNYIIKSVLDENFAIDLRGKNAVNGTNVELYSYVAWNSQRWNVEYLGNGYYSIKPLLDENMSLDIAYNSKASGANIQIFDNRGTDNQQWIIKEAGNGYYYIVSKSCGLYLDIYKATANKGANIQLFERRGTNNQKFKFETVEGKISDSLESGTYVMKSALNENLVIDNATKNIGSGTNIQLSTLSNSENQYWDITYLGNGYYSIKTSLTNDMSLDVFRANDVPGTNIQLWNYSGGNNQRWIIRDDGNGYYYIISDCGGLYADVYKGIADNGTNIQLWNYGGGNNQKFKFEKVSKPLPSETLKSGTYVIQSALNNNLGLDVYTKSTNNGTNIQLWNYGGGNNQKWNVEYLGDGYYSIKTALSDNMSLDVYGGSGLPGANVQLFSYTGGNNQQWIIKDAGDGYFYIISKCNGLYVDVYQGNAKNGANVQMFNYRGGNNQKFKFIPTEVNYDVQTYDNGIYNILIGTDVNKSVDVEGKSKINGTNISMFRKTNDKNQLWYLTYVGDGYYTFKSAMNTSLVLTANGNTFAEGTNVVLDMYSGRDAQLWRLKDLGNGYVSVISKASELYLTGAAPVSNGVNIQLGSGNNGDLQKFVLEKYDGKLTYRGMDISAHQGSIDWSKVASSGIEFVIIRVGYGNDLISQDDSYFKANIEGCKKYNIPYGIYLYSYAQHPFNGSATADSEVNHVMRLIGEINKLNYGPNLGTKVFYDVEDAKWQGNLSKDTLTNVIDRFCSSIENKGYSCGVYASQTWLEEKFNTSILDKKYDIWVAQWPEGETPVTFDQMTNRVSSYKGVHKYWQFTSFGSVNGINGRVDLDFGYNIFD